jgi:HSP20 family molecular chaperone IbpA
MGGAHHLESGERVSAHVRDGFLTVTLPKRSEGPKAVRVSHDE